MFSSIASHAAAETAGPAEAAASDAGSVATFTSMLLRVQQQADDGDDASEQDGEADHADLQQERHEADVRQSTQPSASQPLSDNTNSAALAGDDIGGDAGESVGQAAPPGTAYAVAPDLAPANTQTATPDLQDDKQEAQAETRRDMAAQALEQHGAMVAGAADAVAVAAGTVAVAVAAGTVAVAVADQAADWQADQGQSALPIADVQAAAPTAQAARQVENHTQDRTALPALQAAAQRAAPAPDTVRAQGFAALAHSLGQVQPAGQQEALRQLLQDRPGQTGLSFWAREFSGAEQDAAVAGLVSLAATLQPESQAAAYRMILNRAPMTEAESSDRATETPRTLPPGVAQSPASPAQQAAMAAAQLPGTVGLGALLNRLPPDLQAKVLNRLLQDQTGQFAMFGSTAAADRAQAGLPMGQPAQAPLYNPAMQSSATGATGTPEPDGTAFNAETLLQWAQTAPLALQGPSWSAVLHQSSSPDPSVLGELTRSLDLAMDSPDLPGDMAAMAQSAADLPPGDRLPALQDLLTASGRDAELGQAAQTAVQALLPGLPPSEQQVLRQTMAAQHPATSSMQGLGLAGLGGLSPVPTGAAPQPTADNPGFAAAIEAGDRGELEADGLDAAPDAGAAGQAIWNLDLTGDADPGLRPAHVVVFHPPGMPRFHTLMERLSREHPRLMHHDVRGYRQCVEQALAGGSVHISMSTRYPWPAACDLDSQGNHLLSINPNLLQCDMNRLVDALIAQMRRAALTRAGTGQRLAAIQI